MILGARLTLKYTRKCQNDCFCVYSCKHSQLYIKRTQRVLGSHTLSFFLLYLPYWLHLHYLANSITFCSGIVICGLHYDFFLNFTLIFHFDIWENILDIYWYCGGKYLYRVKILDMLSTPNNRDYNIDQNNREFYHNQVAPSLTLTKNIFSIKIQ